MINDSERREIAARLMREACAWRETFPESECDFSDAAAMMQDLCVFIGLERNALCSEVFKRLADLIDRPTSKREHNGAYWRCAHCGAFMRKDAVIIDGLDVVPLRHCGNCGRELDYD